MDQRISLITLGVADIEKAAGFYESLGWARVESEPGIVAFDLIGQTLGLYPMANLLRDMGLDASGSGGFSGVTLGHNLGSRAEVDALYARFADAGGRGVRPPHEVFWGGYISYAADLDGHVWEIAHNPFSALGPNGEFQWGGA